MVNCEGHRISHAILIELMEQCHHDTEDLEFIFEALKAFSAYHDAIIKETAYDLTFDGTDVYDFKENYQRYDRQRTSAHNLAIQSVGALNKLCEIKGIDKVYDGIISEDQPYRREIADAIINLLGEIVESRR